MELPEVKSGRWYFRQLFVNGRRAVRARTPNADEQMPWWRIRSSDAKYEDTATPVTLSVTGQIKAYQNPGDVELVYINNNDGGRKRWGSVAEAEQKFTLAPPHRWNPKCFKFDWNLSFPSAGQACYLENAVELLDQAGEWYLDRHTGVLSYWPRPGEDLNDAEVVAPVVQHTLLAVVGTPQRPVLNLHFQGLHIEHVDWPLPAWGYMGLFGCNVTDGPGEKPGHRFIEAAVEYQHARQCSFRDGGIAHVGAMGLCLRQGTASIAVEGNEIHDLGGGGIGAGYPNAAAGYLEAAPPPEEGEYRDYRFANNYIHHCGMDYYGAAGVDLFASQDSVVAHNLIHDIAYFGICICGSQDPKVQFARNNTVEYNHIQRAMKVTVDGAGLYSTFTQADPGCLIRGNVVHEQVANHLNSRPLGPYSAAGIYLDMANSGCRYEQNVVYQTPWPLFPNNWRSDTTSWRENVFLKTGTPPPEFLAVVHARAGLEPAYRRSLLKTEAPTCDFHVLVPAESAQDGWTAGQFHLPGAGRGVVQVFRAVAGRELAARLKLRGLDTTTSYEIRHFSGPLNEPSGKGKSDPPMVSRVDAVDRPAQEPSSPNDAIQFTGRELMEQGLPVKLPASPHVMWAVYQPLKTPTDAKPTGEKP